MRSWTVATRPPCCEALAREGLVIPVDRTGERYRYHRLVRDTLRAELRREPRAGVRAPPPGERLAPIGCGRRSGRAPFARGRRRAGRWRPGLGKRRAPGRRWPDRRGRAVAEHVQRVPDRAPPTARARRGRVRAGPGSGSSAWTAGLLRRPTRPHARGMPRRGRGGCRAHARRARPSEGPLGCARTRARPASCSPGGWRRSRARLLPGGRGGPSPGRPRTGDEAARGGRAACGGPRAARPRAVPRPARRPWRSSAPTGTR